MAIDCGGIHADHDDSKKRCMFCICNLQSDFFPRPDRLWLITDDLGNIASSLDTRFGNCRDLDTLVIGVMNRSGQMKKAKHRLFTSTGERKPLPPRPSVDVDVADLCEMHSNQRNRGLKRLNL